jgi:hypothetical protein
MPQRELKRRAPLCASRRINEIPRKVVSLLELLRAYAEAYAYASYWLGFNVPELSKGEPLVESTRAVIVKHLQLLREECERTGLEMTILLIDEVLPRIEQPDSPNLLLHESLHNICNNLKNELSLQLFIRITPERRKFYESPFKGWEAIISRFGEAARDIEEMNKCFALSRYTASMFHALQVAECGAIKLGDYIGVADPKKGWGPTEKELSRLVKAGHSQLPSHLSGSFDFLEQMHREIVTMCLAWRHKVDHAANHLVIVPNTDFTPDIAEHVIGAVKVFMLRLAEELPEGVPVTSTV